MRHLIDQYLEAHEGAWALTTWKSERSRLNAVTHLIDQGPEKLVEDRAKHLKPYALKTLLIRIVHFENWAREAQLHRGSEYGQYIRKHKNRFKHAYVKEDIEIGFDEVAARIGSGGLDHTGSVRDAAESLLRTGLRISELYGVDNGRVTGKGGKQRRTYGTTPSKPNISQASLRRALRKIGLKPHTLRKLCATRAAERGATPADLCKIFGWSSISTAYQYLQPKDDQRLEELMK